MPGEQDEPALVRRAGDAHDERQVGDEAVRDAEDDGPQRSRARAAVPALGRGDRSAAAIRPGGDGRVLACGDDARRAVARPVVRAAAPAGCRLAVQALPDLGVLALVGGDRLDLRLRLLGLVDRLLVALERLHEVGHGPGAQDPRGKDDEPDPEAWLPGRRHVDALGPEPTRPDLGVASLVAGDVPEGGGAVRVLLDRGEGVVQDDGVLLEPEVLEALRDVHPPRLPNVRASAGPWIRRTPIAAPALAAGDLPAVRVPSRPTLAP